MPGISSGLARAEANVLLSSGASTGPLLLEAKNWKSYNFTAFAVGSVIGAQLTIYSTIDVLTSGVLGNPNYTPGYQQLPFVSAGNWFPLIAPSSQTETAASYANPITVFDGTQILTYGSPLYAVMASANVFTGGGQINFTAYAVN